MISILLLMVSMAEPVASDSYDVCRNVVASAGVIGYEEAIETALSLECDDVFEFTAD